MSHNHHHHNSADNIKIAFILNFIFTLIEIIGGIFTNSMAILSDALHDLGDCLSLGISWCLENFSRKKPDDKYSYGYARFSLLSAMINSLVLISGSVLVLSESIPRIINPQMPDAKGMLIISVFGIVINGLAVLRLRKGTSMNERAVWWHLLEDVLGWISVLITSILLMFFNLPALDAVLSVLIAVFLIYNVLKNLKKIFSILLQRVPADLSIEDIQRKLVDNTDVLSVHHTHIWSLDGQKNLMSTHIVVRDDISVQEIVKLKKDIRQLMQQNDIEHVTIEIEFENEICPSIHC